MRNIHILLSITLSFFTIFSCKESSETTVGVETTEQQIERASNKLNQWFKVQFDEEVADSPEFQTYLGIKTDDYGKWDDISSQKEVEEYEEAKMRLAYLNDSVNTSLLNEHTLLSYQLFKKEVKDQIEGFQYRLYNYPVNQMHGIQSGVPGFLINMHDIESKSDANAYISRLSGIFPLFKQLAENLKLREKNGIIPPKFVFNKVLQDCENILTGKPFDTSNTESTLLADFTEKITELDLPEAEIEQLINQASKKLVDSVAPAYKHLMALLEDQRQRATTEDGVWKFPKGDDFYQYRLKKITTTSMSAEEIHRLGLREVDRIHEEMRKIMKKVDYKGTLKDFFIFMKEDEQFYYEDTAEGRKEYLKLSVELIEKMKSKLDCLFITKPKADITVKAVESFREKSAGKAFYQRGTPDGKRPGKYYANLYDMKAMPKYQMEALAYHEGIPGHHMQRSIAQELENVPDFRKYTSYTAYTEGWGLYNEFLPKEIGMYKDPYSDFGRLAMELWRACRLVVDTGIHNKKWTREEGINYYVENTPNAESDAVKMVERHIVMPGQATAYKIGMNKILELRKKAKKELGAAFDIRKFHEVILTNGAVPLDILEELVNTYINQEKAS